MTVSSRKMIGYGSIIGILFISIYACVFYILKPTPSDLIDNNTVTLISDFLDQSNNCDNLAEKNQISLYEIEKLKSLEKYDVLTYSDMKEVEQELNCLSEPMSKMLYTGWLIKRSNDTIKPRVDLEEIISQLLMTSIILKINGLAYIPEESLKTLEQINFFKEPFKMQRSLLDNDQ